MSLTRQSNNWQLLRNLKGKYGLALLALPLLLAVAWLLWLVSGTFEPSGSQLLRAVATAVSVPILLLWFHNRERLEGRLRNLSWVVVVGIVAVFAAGSALVVILNVIEPGDFDFLTFWLNGQVAIRGLNFYEPSSYHSIPLPISTSPAFTPEILDVGFLYPPPTIILFMPLGLLDFRIALVVWYAAQVAVLILCILLLWKTFLSDTGLTGLVLSAAFILVGAGTFSTFQFAQTTFLALLMVLLSWRDRNRMRGGLWLALGALVKPLLLILLMIPLLRRNGRVLLGALITFLVISILTIGIVGIETFFTYFSDNPVNRVPGFIFTEIGNSSLLATILRLGEGSTDFQSVLTHPIHIGIVAVLTGVTAWLLYSFEEDSLAWGLGIALVLALIVYPASLILYSVLLVIPLLVMWESREELPIGVWGTGAMITSVLVLLTMGGFVFVANVALWMALVASAGWMLMSKGLGSSESPENLQLPERSERAVHQPLESIQ